MKQSLLNNFSFVRENIDFSLRDLPQDSQDLVEDKNPMKAMLQAVYAPDPISGFPTGDIACYVSDKTSPDIKNWILANLMVDVSSAKLPAAPHGVDDNVIEALMRQSGEDTASYAERVNQYMQHEVDVVNSALAAAKQSDNGDS